MAYLFLVVQNELLAPLLLLFLKTCLTDLVLLLLMWLLSNWIDYLRLLGLDFYLWRLSCHVCLICFLPFLLCN